MLRGGGRRRHSSTYTPQNDLKISRTVRTYQHEKNTYQHEKNTYQHVDQRSGLETPKRCKKTQVGTQKNTGRGAKGPPTPPRNPDVFFCVPTCFFAYLFGRSLAPKCFTFPWLNSRFPWLNLATEATTHPFLGLSC